MKWDYEQKAKVFIEAIQVAEKIVSESAFFEPVDKANTIGSINQIKQLVINPMTEFENLKSLGYLEKEFFTYWNEGSNSDIDLFWKEIHRKQLPYRKTNIATAVLKRKRIINDTEYNDLKDFIVVGLQTGEISKDEYLKLSRCIDQYERNPL